MTDQTQVTIADADDDPKKRKAEHSLLIFAGDGTVAVTEDWEKANGIRYKDLESGEVLDYQPKSPAALLMGALFGFRTLATNEASQVRQKKGAIGTGAAQVQGIRDRFDLIESGTWVSRTREPTVYDKAVLAEAVADTMIASGKAAAADRDSIVQMASRLVADDAGEKAALQTKGVKDAYDKLVGRTSNVKSADDLMAALLKA
jgi:hypothetical protein